MANLPTHYKNMTPKPYIRPHDLKGQPQAVTIKELAIEKIYDAGLKHKIDTWVVYFEETQKYLVGREIILDMIAETTGQEDPTNWPGHVIELFVRWEDHGGKKWELVRVRKATSSPKPVSAPQSEEAQHAAPQQKAPFQPSEGNSAKTDTPKDAFYAHAFGVLGIDKDTAADILRQCESDFELALVELKKNHTPPPADSEQAAEAAEKA